MIQVQNDQQLLDEQAEMGRLMHDDENLNIHRCSECSSEKGFERSVPNGPDDFDLGWQCEDCGYLDL